VNTAALYMDSYTGKTTVSHATADLS